MEKNTKIYYEGVKLNLEYLIDTESKKLEKTKKTIALLKKELKKAIKKLNAI